MKTRQFSFNSSFNNNERYELYDLFRREEPVLWCEEVASWLIFKHEDVSSLARSSFVTTDRLIKEKLHSEEIRNSGSVNEIVNTISKWMVYNEDPVHGKLRGFMNKTFDRVYIERLRSKMDKILFPRIDSLKGNSKIDFVKELAHPVPAEILSVMLGLNEISTSDFLKWSDSIADFMQDFVVSPIPNKEIADKTKVNLLEMKEAFSDAISFRKRKYQDDLLSDLARDTGEGQGQISEDELMLQLIHLVFGGHKIPQFVLSNTLHNLFNNKKYMPNRENSSDLYFSKLVDESMRFESPIQFITRHSRNDFEIKGKEIQAGDSIYLMLGSANRDGSVYPGADQFLLSEERKRKGIHFGSGPHVCIGAALANMMISSILKGFFSVVSGVNPEYDLDRPEWTKNETFHGIVTMPISIKYH